MCPTILVFLLYWSFDLVNCDGVYMFVWALALAEWIGTTLPRILLVSTPELTSSLATCFSL